MYLSFIGAAREVTGSCYLLETAGKTLLIDRGMEQGKDVYENVPLPMEESKIDAVILTHAHIDHSGLLPLLYKNGFRGTVYATPATIELSEIMLRDSAYIQEMETEWQNRKRLRSGLEPLEPLYTQEDAAGLCTLMRPASYEQYIEIFPDIALKMVDAGHLFGSASIMLKLTEEGTTKRLIFSGDIGNLNQPIIKDPRYIDRGDYVVMESTYGDRLHGPRPDYLSDLADCLQTTFDRGGHVVIPSFAVGRTQELLYFFREIKEKELIHGHDGFKVYLDSPLAIRATEIFNETGAPFFDDEMNALIQSGVNPLQFEGLTLTLTPEESKLINQVREPAVIISASGMCEAGRIRHHLKHNLFRPECTVLFVGYQSVGTLGRRLADGEKEVRLFNEDIVVRAEIRTLKAMSGHADQNGLETWALAFNPPPTRYFITHGDEDSALAFENLLKEKGLATSVPYSGDAWDLAVDQMVLQGSREPAKKIKKKAVKKQRYIQSAASTLEKLLSAAQGWKRSKRERFEKEVVDLLSRWDK
jgi:metallo-beta-lactamase family protein